MGTRHATTMDEVERIKAAIKALPEIYRPLVCYDLNWAQRNLGKALSAVAIIAVLIGHYIF